MLHKFKEVLFNSSEYAYAIIDAAKIKELTTELLIYEPEYQMLFEGEDAIKLEEVAPYLVRLDEKNVLTQWIIDNVYGNDGAIFFHSHHSIETLTEHFKRFIKVTREVTDPKTEKCMIQEGFLAYYDPRVLPEWLESVDLAVKRDFLSQTSRLYYEDLHHKHVLHAYDETGKQEKMFLDEARV
ncbi:MAG: DUF4123 domain-containing protein [Sulfurovum sp.]|nr:DUF4123 domain-containing protein [Sulfurovum sp.]